ncbi:MAG TPA: V-type ATP synthase subunit E family protein [Pilimelia sp.]|nr:V-type ATP synthase subunit E family protein [Pilimelia sp.]
MTELATTIASAPDATPERPPGDALAAALEPVRQALLAAARANADRLRADAAARATRIVADARAQAEGVRVQACARGAEEAAAALAAERSGARREARTAVLRARREAYDALQARGIQAVARLVDEPAYGSMRDRLVDAVHRALGPDARVSDADGGGVVGEAPGRRLDYSLPSFADAALDAIAADMFEAVP